MEVPHGGLTESASAWDARIFPWRGGDECAMERLFPGLIHWQDHGARPKALVERRPGGSQQARGVMQPSNRVDDHGVGVGNRLDYPQALLDTEHEDCL